MVNELVRRIQELDSDFDRGSMVSLHIPQIETWKKASRDTTILRSRAFGANVWNVFCGPDMEDFWGRISTDYVRRKANGTALGLMLFEKEIARRSLLRPGKWFSHETVKDRTQRTMVSCRPRFTYRAVKMYDRMITPDWAFWQRVNGFGVDGSVNGVWHAHNLHHVVTQAQKRDHREWARYDPSPPTAGENRVVDDLQCCMSNPELRQFVADQVKRTMDDRNRPGTFSVSPADAGPKSGWCQCAECNKLRFPDWKMTTPDGQKRACQTLYVLDFYVDVARRCFPHEVCGYVYHDYLDIRPEMMSFDDPHHPGVRLQWNQIGWPVNLSLVVAPNRLRTESVTESLKFLADWRRMFSGTLYAHEILGYPDPANPDLLPAQMGAWMDGLVRLNYDGYYVDALDVTKMDEARADIWSKTMMTLARKSFEWCAF